MGRNSIFHPELMVLICSVSAFVNTSITIIVSGTRNDYQRGGSLSMSHSEIVSHVVSAVLLILAAMVLLIQMSIYGKYFVNHYEAKVLAGVVTLMTGVLYM